MRSSHITPAEARTPPSASQIRSRLQPASASASVAEVSMTSGILLIAQTAATTGAPSTKSGSVIRHAGRRLRRARCESRRLLAGPLAPMRVLDQYGPVISHDGDDSMRRHRDAVEILEIVERELRRDHAGEIAARIRHAPSQETAPAAACGVSHGRAHERGGVRIGAEAKKELASRNIRSRRQPAGRAVGNSGRPHRRE